MNKLSRKDIKMLEMLAKTQGSKDALGEYIKQRNKAVKAYKAFREAVVNGVEVQVEEKSPNELRAEIIKRAKEFVKEEYRSGFVSVGRSVSLGCVTYINFVINTEKRTVVALLKSASTDRVRSKGIAKCHPDDVFNEHISKAIALGRALGKDVSEFENAVQPDEIVIGHSISSTRKDGSYYEYPSVTKVEEGKVWGVDSVRNSPSFTLIKDSYEGLATRPKIIDDTHAIYEEEM